MAKYNFSKIVSLNTISGLHNVLDKEELYAKILRDFHTKFTAEIKLIQEEYKKGDLVSVERRIHSAKGLSGTIGATKLHEAAREFDLELKQNKASEVLFVQFSEAMDEVLKDIAKFFLL